MDVDEENETSLLDLPGVEEIGGSGEEHKAPSELSSSPEKPSVKASGSGLTFFLNSSMEDEDDEEDDEELREFAPEDTLQDSNISSHVIQRTLNQHEEGLQKELTERYISGQLSFNEYIRQIGNEQFYEYVQ